MPESVRPQFLATGWFPGRRAWFTFSSGLKSLASYQQGSALVSAFGGLRVGHSGPGQECATSDVAFYRWPTAAHRESVVEMESPGDDLFPLAEAQVGYLELFVDARGRLLVYAVPDGSLTIAGDSFGEGIERLLLGRRWWPDATKERP